MGRGRNKINLIGEKFGRLTVVSASEKVIRKNGSTITRWLCDCDCGGHTVAATGDLRGGHTRSCGCYQRQRTSEASRKHGMRHTKIYHTWLDIKGKCHNPKNHSFKNYGGRGIAVCDEWRNSFDSFYKYVSALPHYGEDGYSIDRINNDGNYEPGNVRWATIYQQAINKRTSIRFLFNDKELPLVEIGRLCGIKYPTVLFHYHRGDLKEYIENKGERNGVTDQRVQSTGSNTV